MTDQEDQCRTRGPITRLRPAVPNLRSDRPGVLIGTNVWQVMIIALLAATAGWTTVAVIACARRPPPSTHRPTRGPGRRHARSNPPVADLHDAPEPRRS
jgi:hypothetical protein